MRIYGETQTSGNTGSLVIAGDGAMRAGSGITAEYIDDGTAGPLCDRTFIDAVITGDASKIRSSYADAFKSLALTLACNQSIAEGKPVSVPLE